METSPNRDIFEILNEKIPLLREGIISLLKTKINLSLPFAGPIINEFLFELGSRIKQNRVNDYVTELGERVKGMESSIISVDYLNSDEFYDLTIKVFETATKISSTEKRKALAKIYANAIYGINDLNSDLRLLFSDFIETITPAHIYILNFIQKNKHQLVEIESYENYYKKFIILHPTLELDKYQFKLFSTDLETKALISTGAGLDNYDSTQALLASESHINPSVKLTTLGEKFLSYLNE